MTPFIERLVGSPCCLPDATEETLFPAYRKLGFHKFEGFSSWAACRHEWTSDPAEARERAARHGLRFTSYHLPPLNDDVETSLANAIAAARFAAALGAKIVLFKAQRRELFKLAGRRFLDSIEREGLGLTPVLQNHAGSAITTLDDYRDAFAAFDDDPRIRAILEVGHFQRVGQHFQKGWDFLGDRVALIHVNEIRAGKSVKYGTGEVDFEGLVRAIKKNAYAGDVVVELELENHRENPEETLEGLKSAIDKLCALYASA
jgi:sugar phosphate isomerase/epimerase